MSCSGGQVDSAAARGKRRVDKRKATSPAAQATNLSKTRRMKEDKSGDTTGSVAISDFDLTSAALAESGLGEEKEHDIELQAFVNIVSKVTSEEKIEALLQHESKCVRQFAIDLKRSAVPEVPTAERLLFGARATIPGSVAFSLEGPRKRSVEFAPPKAPLFVSEHAAETTLKISDGQPTWVGVNEVRDELEVQDATYKYEYDSRGNIMLPPHILRVPDVHNASAFEIFSFKKAALVKTWQTLRDWGKGREASTVSDYTSGNVSPLPDDTYFVMQRLLGVNPAAIKILDDSARNLVNIGLVATGLPKLSVTDRLFLCDYSILTPFSSQITEGRGADGQYVPAPIVVLKYTEATAITAAGFTPEAILYDQAGKYPNAVRQANPSPQWEFGKMCARVADWNCHELGSHLTLCHLVSEVAMMAMYRNLPRTHPLFQLLLPHFYMTLPLNANARSQLVPDIIAEKLTAFTSDQCFQFIAAVYGAWNFEAHYVPTDLQARGVADLPTEVYPFGKTASLVWDSVKMYVTKIVENLEALDESKSLLADPCLRSFLQALHEGDAKLPGFPDIQTNDALIDALTMIIYTASHQHSAVNYFQEQFLSYCPQAPSVLAVPPASVDSVTSDILLKALPTPRTAKLSAAVFDMLSDKPSDSHQMETFKLTDTPDNVEWVFLNAYLLEMQKKLTANLHNAQIPVAAMVNKDCLAQSVLI